MRIRRPCYVDDSETLGRELFNGHLNKSKTALTPAAFLQKGGRHLSCSRLSLAARILFLTLAGQHMNKRRKRVASTRFYGFAEITAANVRALCVDGLSCAHPIGVPTIENPFHSDIRLPPDMQKDFFLDVATKLRNKAKYVPYDVERA